MSERIALSRLLVDATSDRAVAWRDGEILTMGGFRARAGAWCRFFEEMPGARVALHFEDTLEFAAALFGAWHAGKQPWLPGDVLPATLARMEAQVDRMVGEIGDGEQAPGAGAGAEASPIEWTGLDPRAASLVVYTSGSSGEPVAIEKKLHQLDDEVAALEQRFGELVANASIHGTVSHQHIYGLLFRVLWPLSSGRVFHAHRLATPAQIAVLPGDLPVALVASPALLKRLPPATHWRAIGPDLRAVFSSGGPLPADASDSVVQFWQQRPIEIFGSTETGGIASRQGSDQPWSCLPGVEWRLAGEQLEIRSPHLPDAAWFATSDRAVASASGFQLLGRADRIVKIEERRISLTAIEDNLAASPWLREARVTTLPEGRALVVAIAVPNDAGRDRLARIGKQMFVQELRRELSASVDAIALPRRWRFVAALPVDAQGKATDALAQALFEPTEPPRAWLQRDTMSARVQIDVEPSLRMFDGHFPVTPVLPGVALLDWAISLGREAFSPPPRLLRTEVLKFQSIVRPGTRLTLVMDWREDTATLGFGYTSADGAHASGRLVFGAPVVQV